MNIQQISDMAADALAGEELQFRNNGDWLAVAPTTCEHLFDSKYPWRIKPTIEVNGVMMSKRQAKAAWVLSGATSYEFSSGMDWVRCTGYLPIWDNTMYRWQEPEWIYVNGEKITRSGGPVQICGLWVANDTEGQNLAAAIAKLIEIK
jgi:hypothetical protein